MHVTNNKCTFCNIAEETIEHLHQCKHQEVQDIRDYMKKKIQKIIGYKWIWFSTNSPNPTNCSFPKTWGDSGLLPKSLETHLPTDIDPTEKASMLSKTQKYVIKASLKI